MSPAPTAPGQRGLRDRYYRELFGRNILRLTLTYLAPLVLLTAYFYAQYSRLSREGQLLHLRSVAEHQANTLDLFLRERVVNLANKLDDPRLPLPPSSAALERVLEALRKDSDTFSDVGFFDSSGVQTAYAGPFPSLEQRNYGEEPWYVGLKQGPERFVITDVYLGFRGRPHFTIAVSRTLGGRYMVQRAALDPERIYEYIESLKGSDELNVSIVNTAGQHQLLPADHGSLLAASPIRPPRSPQVGSVEARLDGTPLTVAYAWLRTAPWAVIVEGQGQHSAISVLGSPLNILGFSAALILVVLSVITIRAKRIVELQIDKEMTQAQFEHAAKLASVGELSAGIAHEINNPLAIISEEAGLIKDLMNPELCEGTTFAQLQPHLDNIQEAVFRCRDITRKLLSFVRKTDIQLMPHDVNQLLDELIDGFWLREMAVSNIEIVKHYDPQPLTLVTDANQIKQVLLNILNNAADAIDPPGRITLSTARDGEYISVAIADTGRGISQEQMERIFLPFYTTKEVGKGTGLGLSVSYGIVKSLGGKILVESLPGKGSVFTVLLPSRDMEAGRA